MKEYIEKHMESPHYVQSGEMPERYRNSEGWTDYRIGKHIIFAHRVTDYTAENFRDALHAHAYCEIVFRNEGVVQYISGDRTETPQEGSVIVIPPGTLHTTRLLKPSLQ